MEQSRATWTDERLDDLARRVDEGFNRVDQRFESLDGADATAVEARLDARFDVSNARFDALQQTMVRSWAAMTIAVFATLITADHHPGLISPAAPRPRNHSSLRAIPSSRPTCGAQSSSSRAVPIP